MRGGIQYLSNRVRLKKCSGGIVGIGDEENARFFAQREEDSFEREVHLVGVTRHGDPGAVDFRVIAVHRERRLANQDAAAGVDESVEENAQGIVSAIREQKFLRAHAEMMR